jgi:formylglycine-generating enzyme required for sulfatase activity
MGSPEDENSAMTTRPLSLFYSYSHRDEAFRQDLEKHLAFLRRSEWIAEWHDRMIEAGEEWKAEIDHYLATADIVLLLVSADFIASDYCWSVEMTKALARHERREARVIPVILRPCRWTSTPLAKLQAVPKDARPVSEWPSRDAAFDDIATAIERTVGELREQRRRAAEQARQRAEAEAARLAAEQRRQAEAEQERRRRQLEAARKAEEERQRLEAQARRQAEEERQRREAELKRKAEAARQGAEPQSGTGTGAGVTSGLASLWLQRKPLALIGGIGAILFLLFLGGGESPVVGSATRRAGESFRDCDQCPEMVVIPGGNFMMGSPESEEGRSGDEGPQHPVTFARPFAVGKYEVTFDEWDACVAAGGCKERPADQAWGRGKRPVINVSWDGAQQYVAWLAKKTGRGYRLLSEAEWEYAARAGFATRYPWGDEPGINRANFNGSGSQWSGKQTAPVGSFQPNPFGLHDMIGNVWEWTQDCWNDSYKGAPEDGRAWETGDCGRRVVRGGSWDYGPQGCRCAIRNWFEPGVRDSNLGFRLARTL